MGCGFNLIRIKIDNYQQLRNDYLTKIANTGILKFDESDILDFGSNTIPTKSKSQDTYRLLSEYSSSEFLSRIKDYLFNDKGMVKRTALQELIAGPKITPRSMGGTCERSVRSNLCDIVNELGNCNEDNDLQVLQRIFNYRLFSKKEGKDFAYWFMQSLGQDTCPYCNTGYTAVLAGRKKIRAAFDHYFPKSKYPYLAVSLFNLIPICSTCNSLKGEKEPRIVYPYEESFDEEGRNFVFRVKPDSLNHFVDVWTGNSNRIIVDVEPQEKYIIESDADTEYANRLTEGMDYLGLKERYAICHKGEICHIIRNYYEYNEMGLESIMREYPNFYKDTNQIRNALYFANLGSDEWGKSPLNKLKHDLLEQLDTMANAD